VLIDPLPAPPFKPAGVWLPAEKVTAHYVGEVLMRQNRVPNVQRVIDEQLVCSTDEEVGVVIAQSLANLGFKPFTLQTVRDTQRELRNEILFERLIRTFVAERWAGDAGVEELLEAERADSPFAEGVLCARAGKGRVDFFADAFGLLLDEDTATDTSWYGPLVEEAQAYDGHHIDVCLRLFTGREKTFTAAVGVHGGGLPAAEHGRAQGAQHDDCDDDCDERLQLRQRFERGGRACGLEPRLRPPCTRRLGSEAGHLVCSLRPSHPPPNAGGSPIGRIGTLSTTEEMLAGVYELRSD